MKNELSYALTGFQPTIEHLQVFAFEPEFLQDFQLLPVASVQAATRHLQSFLCVLETLFDFDTLYSVSTVPPTIQEG